MQKGDDNQQLESLTSEYSTATLLFNGPPASSFNGPNFNDIAKVLSQVELPSPSPTPSPALATSHSFQDGQSSGTKKVDDAIEGNCEREKELKDAVKTLQESGMQFQSQVTRDTRHVRLTRKTTEQNQRRRSLIHKRIRDLKELIPNCNTRDQASILDNAITYIRSLQMQVQMMQLMGADNEPQCLYMSPGRHPSLQGPYLAPYFMMRPMEEMGYNMGYYGSDFNPISPILPSLGSCFHPLVPPMHIGSSRLLPIPQLQCPSQTSEHVYSTTKSEHMPPVTNPEEQ